MKLSKTLAVLFIAGGLSTSAQAAPSRIDSMLSHFVTTALSVTVDELNSKVQESVANTVHSVDSTVKNARVEISEVSAEKTAAQSEE